MPLFSGEHAPLTERDITADRDRLTKYLTAFKAHMLVLVNQFKRGDIDFATWRSRAEAEIRSLHLFAAQLGRGGVDRLQPADRERLNLLVDAQMRFFNAYAAQEMPPSPTKLSAARLSLYGGAIWATYWTFLAHSLGLPDLPAYPGQYSACMNNCLCYLLINKIEGDGNWDVFWQRTSDESCPQCVNREIVWSPLRVRAGIVQPYDATGLFI